MGKLSGIPVWKLCGAVVLLLVMQAVVLHLMGRHLLPVSGQVKLWAGDPLGPDNSQQLTDWYSLTHVVHGILLYGLLSLAAPRLPFAARLLLAVGAEVSWEMIENSPMVIKTYRKQALAAAFAGDSIINSLSDTFMMCLGFFIASRLPWWLTIIFALCLELVAAAVIHDNLTLNVLNFLVSWPALKHWQAGYRP